MDAEKDVLKVRVFSERKKGKDPVDIGIVEFPFKQILETPFMDDWFPVMNPDNPVCSPSALFSTPSNCWPIEGSWVRRYPIGGDLWQGSPTCSHRAILDRCSRCSWLG